MNKCKGFCKGRIAVSLLAWLSISFNSFSQTEVSKAWSADQENGTYINPILHADYSDPDVIRVGSDYYMTASSFNCAPGLPILHSKDMVNWKLINHALQKQIPLDVFSKTQHGNGVWAPSWNYRNKEFYIYYPDPDYGIYMIKSKDPAGVWSKPVLVLAGKGYIDPTTLWDDNGQAYLMIGWAGSRAGVKSLLTVFKMNGEGTAVIDEGKHVYDGHGIDPTVEGPKLYKRNGYYYVMAPAGGVATGWQLALRSKNIYGPYERRDVMDQGETHINGPHQGALVQTPKGEDWFFHFQDKDAYGRIVHLQPVKWVNGWPVIGNDTDGDGKGAPVLTYRKPDVGGVFSKTTPADSDEFNKDSLGLQWQWQANPQLQWSALIRNTGFLRLFASPMDSATNLWSVPNLLMQKFPASDFTVTTKMNFTPEVDNPKGKRAGLVIMGYDYATLTLTKTDKGFQLSQIFCEEASKGNAEQVMEQKIVKSGELWLRVQVSAPGAICNFSYSEDGENFKNIGKPFKAKPGRWIGAKVGLFCVGKPGTTNGGYTDVDWFRVTR